MAFHTVRQYFEEPRKPRKLRKPGDVIFETTPEQIGSVSFSTVDNRKSLGHPPVDPCLSRQVSQGGSRTFSQVYVVPLNLPPKVPSAPKLLQKLFVLSFRAVKVALRHQKLILPEAQIGQKLRYGNHTQVPCKNYGAKENAKTLSEMQSLYYGAQN